jgi:hypothetical protein
LPGNATANIALNISPEGRNVLRCPASTFFDTFLKGFPSRGSKNTGNNAAFSVPNEQGFFCAGKNSHGPSRNTAAHDTGKASAFSGKLLTSLFWREPFDKSLIVWTCVQNFRS